MLVAPKSPTSNKKGKVGSIRLTAVVSVGVIVFAIIVSLFRASSIFEGWSLFCGIMGFSREGIKVYVGGNIFNGLID